jgi:hypothetical protein
MKQTIISLVLLATLIAGLFYFGGYILLAGLGAIALTFLVVSAFSLGSLWTRRMIQIGAEIAIKSAGQNDAHDAIKIKALAGLAQETMKTRNQLPSPAAGYPVLPPFSAVDGSFTINGLDSEEVELEGD